VDSRAIDRRIASAIMDGVMEVLTGLLDPESGARAKFRRTWRASSRTCSTRPAAPARQQCGETAVRASGHAHWLSSIWKELCDAAVDDLAQPESRLAGALEKPISLVAQTLATDDIMQQHIDDAVERLAQSLISWRTEIGAFIAEVVRSWDTRTLVERLELVVGSDLQYIRMNGTIVGACAGCLIFIAAHVLS